MRMNKKIIGVAMLAVLQFSAPFKASAKMVGSGVRGGGHVLDVDSTPYLMDLASKAVCDWKRGSEFVAELPDLRDTLKKLAAVDWYFASDLEDEIKHLNFCMTGPLYQVPAYERNSAVIRPQGERPRQAGYRFYDNAFIDSEIFSRMNGGNQAMLIIHEAAHSYLSMNTFDRALKLRSMIKTIDKIRQGDIITREKLHYAMKMNEILFPLEVARLDNKKAGILFLKGDTAYKLSALLKVERPESLIELNDYQVMALSPWDYYNFGHIFQRDSLLSESLVATMRSLSPSELSLFLKEKKMDYINLAKLALNEFYSFTKEQQNEVVASESFNQMLISGFDELLKEKFIQEDALITTSVDFQQLVTGKGSERLPVVRLETSLKLPAKLMWLVETILILEENDALKSLVQNDQLYRALGLKNQKEQIETMGVQIPREKAVAMSRLSLLSKSLVQSLLKEIEARVAPEVYSYILKQIDLSKF